MQATQADSWEPEIIYNFNRMLRARHRIQPSMREWAVSDGHEAMIRGYCESCLSISENLAFLQLIWIIFAKKALFLAELQFLWEKRGK